MDQSIPEPFWLPLVVFCLLLTSCAQPSTFHEITTSKVQRHHLQTVFNRSEFKLDKNIVAVPLSDQPGHQMLAAQIRDREEWHLHEEHDLIVYLHKGRGLLNNRHQSVEMTKGDWVIIPRNSPHQFVNRSATPAQAVVIRTPGPEDSDYHQLEKP